MTLRVAFAVFLFSFATLAIAQEAECTAGSFVLPESSIFIGYTRPGEAIVRSAAVVSQRGRIEPYDGQHLSEGEVLQAVLSDTDSSTEVSSVFAYLNRLGRDHCVYQATLAASESSGWQLWASQRLDGEFRAPVAGEQERFSRYRPNCVQQGDLPEDERPPCVRAQLLAVSDLDDDGNLEYWHSVPYTWDAGLGVMEESQQEPAMLIAACPGCSD